METDVAPLEPLAPRRDADEIARSCAGATARHASEGQREEWIESGGGEGVHNWERSRLKPRDARPRWAGGL